MVSWQGGGPLDQPVAQTDEGLSPAVEVLQYENPEGHFAGESIALMEVCSIWLTSSFKL